MHWIILIVVVAWWFSKQLPARYRFLRYLDQRCDGFLQLETDAEAEAPDAKADVCTEDVENTDEAATEIVKLPLDRWVVWVRKRYPSDDLGQWSRQDAIVELEQSFSRSSDYQLLQRMSILAPLAGVIISAVGFLSLAWSEPVTLESPDVNGGQSIAAESGPSSLGSIFRRIAPLFSGVLAGAVLAAWNQVTLHKVSQRAQYVYRAGIDWFDAHVWPSHPYSIHKSATVNTADQVTASIEPTLKLLVSSVEKIKTYGQSVTSASLRIEASMTSAVTEVAAAAESVTRGAKQTRVRLQRESKNVRDELNLLLGAANEVKASIVSLKGEAATRLHKLDASVLSVRGAFTSEYAPAVRGQIAAMQQPADELKKVSGKLESVARGFDTLSTSTSSAAQKLCDSAEKQGDAATRMDSAAVRIESAASAVDSASVRVDNAGTLLQKAGGDFGMTAEQFKSFVNDHLQPTTKSLDKLGELCEQLQNASTSLKELLSAQRELGPIVTALKQATAVTKEFTELPVRLKENAVQADNHFRNSAARMKDAADGVLTDLHGRLINLEQYIQQFSDDLFRRQIDGLDELLRPIVAQVGQIHGGLAPALAKFKDDLEGLYSRLENLTDAVRHPEPATIEKEQLQNAMGLVVTEMSKTHSEAAGVMKEVRAALQELNGRHSADSEGPQRPRPQKG